MQITEFEPAVRALYQQVQAQTKSHIKLRWNQRHEDWLSFDQSGHRMDQQGNLEIILAHSYNLNFTLAHELRHVLLEMTIAPQVDFLVTTTKPEFDRQLQLTALTLIGAVEHVVLTEQQQAAGEITPAVQTAFLKGLKQHLAHISDSIYQTLQLLDGFVFGLVDELASYADRLPQAYQNAQQLWQVASKHAPNTMLGLRRNEIAILQEFNTILQTQGYQALPFGDFVTFEPLLSARQLRLNVGQIFQFKRVDFLDLQTKKPAVLLVDQRDLQNCGTVQDFSGQALLPETYLQVYQQPLQTFLKLKHLGYHLR